MTIVTSTTSTGADFSVNPTIQSIALARLVLQAAVEDGEADSIERLPAYAAYLEQQCERQARRMEARHPGLYHYLADPQCPYPVGVLTP